MPANLTPEYRAAEDAYRKTREPAERLRLLREMLRTIPKHKGTDHLQGDIKARIKQLSEELAGPKKGGARSGPETSIHPEGAAQLALLGPPNVGKSALHTRLTGSHAHVGPYPFTTQWPLPGMLPFEDIQFQVLDLPPIAAEHPLPWIGNCLESADATLLVVDLTEPNCLEQVADLHRLLAARRVHLDAAWPAESGPVGPNEPDDPFACRLPTLVLANKMDLIEQIESELAVFRELSGLRYPTLAVSAETGAGLTEVGAWLFRSLSIVRVYTKLPGQPAKEERPFTLRHGATVDDVARLVHKDIARSLKYARRWPKGDTHVFQVGRDHPVYDGDLLELH